MSDHVSPLLTSYQLPFLQKSHALMERPALVVAWLLPFTLLTRCFSPLELDAVTVLNYLPLACVRTSALHSRSVWFTFRGRAHIVSS